MKKDTFYDQYPLVFPTRAPEQGFLCGNGWHQLLDSLFEVIQKHLEKQPQPTNFNIFCIKEKFGKLRIICGNPTDYIKQTLLQAEEMSSHICETCGEYGQLRDSALWIKVRCDECERTHFAHPRTLSPKAQAALEAGLKSAKESLPIYHGSFAKFADDD
jgi:hypothetical protein